MMKRKSTEAVTKSCSKKEFTLEELAEVFVTYAESNKKTVAEIDRRVKKLESLMKKDVAEKAEEEVEVETETKAEAETTKQTKKVESIAEPAVEAKEEEEIEASSEAKDSAEAESQGTVADLPVTGKPVKIYKAWDFESRSYVFTADIWAAKAIDPDYVPVWVWAENGVVDHVLTTEEILIYLP